MHKMFWVSMRFSLLWWELEQYGSDLFLHWPRVFWRIKFLELELISISFLISGIGGILLFSGIISGGAVVSLLNLSAISAGIYGIRGVYFAIMGDAQISLAHTGTAVGVISVVRLHARCICESLNGLLIG